MKPSWGRSSQDSETRRSTRPSRLESVGKRRGVSEFFVGLLALFVLAPSSNGEDEVTLEDGFVIRGRAEVEDNRLVVFDAPRLYHVGKRRLLEPKEIRSAGAAKIVLEQPIHEGARSLGPVLGYVRRTPIDRFGRRTVVVRSAARKPITVYQGIVEIHPEHVVFEALNRDWRTTASIESLPRKEFDALLENWTRNATSLDRLVLIDLLTRGGHYSRARSAIDTLSQEHPELERRIDELADRLDVAVTERLLDLAEAARDAGQFDRVEELLAELREPAEERLRTRRRALIERFEENRRLLKTIQDALREAIDRADPSANQAILVAAGEEILSAIGSNTVERLIPMSELAGQPGVGPVEQLSLAATGWTLGPDLAGPEPERAARLWRQRMVVMDSIGADSEEEIRNAVDESKRLGTTWDIIAGMLPMLPAESFESTVEGEPATLRVEIPGIATVESLAFLPPNYDPYHRYPTLLALHDIDGSAERQIDFWKKLASRHGWIVLAPRWRQSESVGYAYSLEEHYAILDSLADARRRLAVDPDRVVLAGHAVGGMAAWDIGLSHPDEFAGLIPISAAPRFYCERYRPNAARLPVYAIVGSLDVGVAHLVAVQFEDFFRNGFSAVLVEYPGRGPGAFAEEVPSLARWMRLRRRPAPPKEFEAVSARQCDRRFEWTAIDRFHEHATAPPELYDRVSFRPATVRGWLRDDNSLVVRTTGVEALTVRLYPGMLLLDDPRLEIRVDRRRLHRGPIEPDSETLLREYVRTGDCSRLVLKTFTADPL